MAILVRRKTPALLLFNMTITVSLVQATFFLITFSLYFVSSVSDIIRPRGVAISKAALYDATKDFTCLDGLRTLPFKFVNDDYCDCQDGSDEPGTSACPMGSFHCTNAGHRPSNIPSSRVNDGICDCCDATDEYASSAKCENTCSELGKSARAAAQRQAELVKQGNELRLQLARQGKQIKTDKQVRLDQLKNDLEEASKIKLEKESLKKTAEDLENSALEKYRKVAEEEQAKLQSDSAKEEEKEAFEYFQRLDSDHDGIVKISDLQSRQTFDKDRNGEVSEEEARSFLDGDEVEWTSFLKSWALMKPYIMLERGLFTPPTTASPEVETAAEENLEQFPSDDGDGDEEEEHETDQEDEAALTGEGEDDAEGVKDDKDDPQYDEETLQLIEDARKARTEFEEAERSVRDKEREIKDIEDGLFKDFGPEEEFASLQGQCFEYTDREYTYKLCPFDQISQIPRSGGSDIRLGSWGRWSGTPNKYSAMTFDHGQSCWNGPQRSTVVNINCGVDNVVTAASEPNRCEYALEFSTPAACNAEHKSGAHDEL